MKKMLGGVLAATAMAVSCASPALADCTLDELTGTWTMYLTNIYGYWSCNMTISVADGSAAITVTNATAQTCLDFTFTSPTLLDSAMCAYQIEITQSGTDSPLDQGVYQFTLNQNSNLGIGNGYGWTEVPYGNPEWNGGSNFTTLSMVRIN